MFDALKHYAIDLGWRAQRALAGFRVRHHAAKSQEQPTQADYDVSGVGVTAPEFVRGAKRFGAAWEASKRE